MSVDLSKNPHAYIHVLVDEIKFPFRIETKGLFKKKQYLVEYPNTVELINDGIRKYGNRYIGTFDYFYFEIPEPVQILSKVSYDELVKIFRWRHENELDKTEDYDNAMIMGKPITKNSLLSKKYSHIASELLTLYPKTQNPNDPDYDSNEEAELQMGPPSDAIGPDDKPFGDYLLRLVHDAVLISLHYIYISEHKKNIEEYKSTVLNTLENYQGFTKKPEFEIEKLNPLINAIVKN